MALDDLDVFDTLPSWSDSVDGYLIPVRERAEILHNRDGEFACSMVYVIGKRRILEECDGFKMMPLETPQYGLLYAMRAVQKNGALYIDSMAEGVDCLPLEHLIAYRPIVIVNDGASTLLSDDTTSNL